jgi:transcriptional regulator with XRE-family HTH domain
MPIDELLVISEQIKSLRKQKKWTQQQLAQYSGLDRTTIGALERNDYSDVGIRKVQRVLSLLNKSLALTDVGLPTLDELVAQRDNVEEAYYG